MGSQIVRCSNEWTGTGDHQIWIVGINSLPALDLFQEIYPMESYVNFVEHQQYLSADREYAECFFARNRLEEEKGEGIANDIYIYCIEFVKEGDED